MQLEKKTSVAWRSLNCDPWLCVLPSRIVCLYRFLKNASGFLSSNYPTTKSLCVAYENYNTSTMKCDTENALLPETEKIKRD